jgi:hypothetical protein
MRLAGVKFRVKPGWELPLILKEGADPTGAVFRAHWGFLFRASTLGIMYNE